MKSRILLAAAAALGLGVAANTAPSRTINTTHEQRTTQSVAINNGTTTRQIEEDHFGGYAGGLLRGLYRNAGRTPKEWGMSAACARMVRKNKMARMGIGRARI